MTIDKTRLPARRGALPAFTPVPRACNRHDGWTADRQRGFIEALADTGSVKAAAHAVNMTPEGAYQLRRHPRAASFRKAWEAALALGVQRLEDVAMERALHGTEVPVYSYGKLIGSRVVYNDRLLMFILRNRAPTRFTADGRAAARRLSLNDPAHAAELSRLKRKWEKEWDEENVARVAREEEESEREFQALFDDHRKNYLARMSPRTRALHDAFKAAEEEDRLAREAAEAEEEDRAWRESEGEEDTGGG